MGPPKLVKGGFGLWKRHPSPLSSRPERTRISYFALLATATCAALRRESRMQIPNTTGLNRKSGGAQWRDLRFGGSPLESVFSTERTGNRPLAGRIPLGVYGRRNQGGAAANTYNREGC
jgi:hypothetical protein